MTQILSELRVHLEDMSITTMLTTHRKINVWQKWLNLARASISPCKDKKITISLQLNYNQDNKN